MNEITKKKVEKKKKELKCKWEGFKASVKEKFDATVCWIEEHRDGIVVLVPVAVAAIAEGRKIYDRAEKKAEERREDRERLSRVYDPAAGVYIYTRRPMTDRERVEYSRRRSFGDRPVDILDDMGLL